MVTRPWALPRNTAFGLRVAASGKHPFAARSVGIDPARTRLVALMLGGSCVRSAAPSSRSEACGSSPTT